MISKLICFGTYEAESKLVGGQVIACVLRALSPASCRKMKLSVQMIAHGFSETCSALDSVPVGMSVDAKCLQFHFMKQAGAAMHLDSWARLSFLFV